VPSEVSSEEFTVPVLAVSSKRLRGKNHAADQDTPADKPPAVSSKGNKGKKKKSR